MIFVYSVTHFLVDFACAKNTGYWGLILACAVVLGKTADGRIFRTTFDSVIVLL